MAGRGDALPLVQPREEAIAAIAGRGVGEGAPAGGAHSRRRPGPGGRGAALRGRVQRAPAAQEGLHAGRPDRPRCTDATSIGSARATVVTVAACRLGCREAPRRTGASTPKVRPGPTRRRRTRIASGCTGCFASTAASARLLGLAGTTQPVCSVRPSQAQSGLAEPNTTRNASRPDSESKRWQGEKGGLVVRWAAPQQGHSVQGVLNKQKSMYTPEKNQEKIKESNCKNVKIGSKSRDFVYQINLRSK